MDEYWELLLLHELFSFVSRLMKCSSAMGGVFFSALLFEDDPKLSSFLHTISFYQRMAYERYCMQFSHQNRDITECRHNFGLIVSLHILLSSLFLMFYILFIQEN
ncbi:hypothetical protein ACJIZ3_006847 [Penstemon smallii]|uniref:Uncharacterized protein n=1 Tax=Penstemon smallii TaxID=265156 RepID=A0ABD3S9B4_9LAMI